MKIFIAGEILKAADLNANFAELSGNVANIYSALAGITSTSNIAALDARYFTGTFLNGWSSFQVGSNSSLTYRPVYDSRVGNTVLEVNTYVWARGPILPLDNTVVYRAEFWAKRTATGSANSGNLYFVVSNYDSNVNIIGGDGTDWHYPLNESLVQNTLSSNVWTKYSYSVGPNSGTKDHNTNAKFISIGFIANYTGGNDTIQFAGFSLTPFGTGFGGSIGYTGSGGGGVGFQGSVGFFGSRGLTGYFGSRGEDGFQGSVGFDGSAGHQGSAGFRGFTGFGGSVGDIGYQGSAGVDGSRGLVGYTGSLGPGITGYTGSKGDKGDTGDPGTNGTNGTNGTRGATGFKGSAGDPGGDVGYQGSPGTQGPVGEQGPDGNPGPDGNAGPTGSQGPPGSQGPTGNHEQ